MGYSMGAAPTHRTASRISDEAADLNIGAAVSMRPGPMDEKPSQVPHFYIGSRFTQKKGNIPEVYELSKKPKAYVNRLGLTHEKDGVWDTYVQAMFDCHLKGKEASCGLIYGRSQKPCSLCGGCMREMKVCETANFDSFLEPADPVSPVDVTDENQVDVIDENQVDVTDENQPKGRTKHRRNRLDRRVKRANKRSRGRKGRKLAQMAP